MTIFKICRKLRYLFFFTLVVFALPSAFFLHTGMWPASADTPKKADIIVCLSGNNTRIDKVVSLLQQGLARKIVVTTTVSYQAALGKGVSPDKILKTDWSATTTYQEGMIIKELLDHRYKTVMVVSNSSHFFRVRWVLHHFFTTGSIHFSYIPSDSPALHGFWWSNRNSRLFVLCELPKTVYYWIWHGLFGQEKEPKWAEDAEKVYMRLVTKLFG